LEIAAPSKLEGIRLALSLVAGMLGEPFTAPAPMSIPPFKMTDFDPTTSFAAMYHRLQFTGSASDNVWQPRIRILDLKKCRET
jgi:hypothetical protein